MFGFKMSPSAETREPGHLKKKRLLHYLYWFLNFIGILPSEEVKASKWKTRLYNVYSTIMLLFQPATVFVLFGALYENWGNFEVISDTLFLSSCYTNQSLVGIYFVLNRDALRNVLNSLETTIVSHVEKVAILSSQKGAFGRTIRRGNVAVFIVATSCAIIQIVWIVFPLASNLIPLTLGKIEKDDESLDKTMYLMWIPRNVSFIDTHKFELTLIFKIFSLYFGIWLFSSTIIIVLIVTIYTTGFFNILTQCIGQIEDAFPEGDMNIRGPDLNGRLMAVNANLTVDRMCIERTVTVSALSPYIQSIEEFKTEDSTEEMLEEDAEETTTLSRRVDIASSGTMGRASKDEQRYEYLIGCTIFHQELLELCDNIESLTNPPLLVFFFCSQLTICFSTFALAQGLTDGVVKLFISGFNVCIWPFFMCWFGDNLTEASKALGQAVYECRWYRRSTKYKKHLQMIIMRAQRPVVLSVGKFYGVSLETFADIARVVFSYYSLLKGQSEVEQK